MKKIFTLGALMCCLCANAEDQIYLQPFTTNAGVTSDDGKTMSFALSNDNAKVNIIKFDLYLPSGLSIDTSYDSDEDPYTAVESFEKSRTEYTSGRKTANTGHTAAYSFLGEEDGFNHYKFLINQGTGIVPIQGTNGKLFSVYYLTSSTLADGVYPVYVKNVELTNTVEETMVTVESVSSYVTIGTPSGVEIAPEGNLSAEVIESLPAGADVDITNVTEINGTSDSEVNVTYTPPTTSQSGDPIKWGTICLPVAVSSDASVQYYNVTGIEDNKVVLKAISTVAAGQPAIYCNKTDAQLTIKGTGKITPAAEPTEAALVGVMKKTTVDAGNSYYLKNNQFYQRNGYFTVKAFRAYLNEISSGAPTREIVVDETTAINGLNAFMAGDYEAIYDVNGVQQKDLQKGLNIVKLSNGQTQKIIVK